MKQQRLIHTFLFCAGIVLLLVGAALAVRAQRVVGISQHLHRLAGESHDLRDTTLSYGCIAEENMPDERCTPGDIFPQATAEQICVPGYSRKARNVSVSQKNRIYASYGIRSHRVGEYNIDHLISLQLGGSNEDSNLWPEAENPRPGYHEKIKVENFLHGELCKGEITLRQAQRLVGQHWRDIHYLLQGIE
ncbi:MAG: HNH endonuclease [Patescibacteria group bacterium]